MKNGIDKKLQVVSEYERGKCGYKRLARKYNLSRDTVRAWVLNPNLHEVKKHTSVNEEKDIEYYKAAAEYWQTYAKLVEQEIALQNKKKLQSKAMASCNKQELDLSMHKIAKATGVNQSHYYYNLLQSE
ncbi:MAG: helix-turn-helix domain-containing protein [Treponema sp.]